jgi:FixJ family two-component response regulator
MTAEYHPGSDRVVCIVDDDPSVRSALERLLRCEGLVVRTFASAEEFLGEDLEDKCGCVIADVHLGRMTGLELQATLALRPSSMPVILTSGVADANMELEAEQLGAMAFFWKPFDPGLLIESVRRGLESRT